MGRSAKYKTADDLLDNTVVRNDCLLWPESSCMMPSLGPASPMAKTFGTTSVIRILFTIVRYPPGGPRLVGLCSSKFCVNPYHYVEAKRFLRQRKAMLDPHGLLPSQEFNRHLIAPPDDYLAALYPKKPQHVRFLAETAARAGLDGKGLRPADKKVHPTTFPNAVYADPAKPLFKIKLKTPVPTSPEESISSTHSDPTNSPALVEEDRSPDSFASPLDLSLNELTAALGPTHPPVDQSAHPHDYGRNPETNRPLTLRQILSRAGK